MHLQDGQVVREIVYLHPDSAKFWRQKILLEGHKNIKWSDVFGQLMESRYIPREKPSFSWYSVRGESGVDIQLVGLVGSPIDQHPVNNNNRTYAATGVPPEGCHWTRHCFVLSTTKRGGTRLSRNITAEDEVLVKQWFER